MEPVGLRVVIGLIAGRCGRRRSSGSLAGLLLDDSNDDPVRAGPQVIEDYYFHDRRPEELDDASIDGMVARSAKRNDDKFSHYFTAEQLKQFEAVDLGRGSPASA